jgi:hypothetical protein
LEKLGEVRIGRGLFNASARHNFSGIASLEHFQSMPSFRKSEHRLTL